jgi:Uma2 family endonuclease
MLAAHAVLPVTPPPGEDELPYNFGPPMDSEDARVQMEILIESLNLHWQDRDDFYVGGDMALYFSELQVKKNDFLGPDVFVVLDTVKRVRKSWVVWQEERAPDVVIELLSASTEANDRGPKMRVYARALRVAEYYLFDPETAELEGYRLNGALQAYDPMERDADGSYTSGRLGLKLAVREGTYYAEPVRRLRWLTPEGRVLPTGAELAADATAKLAAARSEAEAVRSQAEAARSQAEAALSQAEAARSEAEAARLRAERLEARLRALGEEP